MSTAPTVDHCWPAMILAVFVRGAYADRAYTALRPLNYDDPNSERRRYYEDHAVQVAAGSYKVLSPNCPPQWGDYGFNVSFDPENGQATSISGTVVYKGFMTRAERAYARARQPMPRAGITGRLIWVSEMMSMMRRFGDNSAGRTNASHRMRLKNQDRRHLPGFLQSEPRKLAART